METLGVISAISLILAFLFFEMLLIAHWATGAEKLAICERENNVHQCELIAVPVRPDPQD